MRAIREEKEIAVKDPVLGALLPWFHIKCMYHSYKHKELIKFLSSVNHLLKIHQAGRNEEPDDV